MKINGRDDVNEYGGVWEILTHTLSAKCGQEFRIPLSFSNSLIYLFAWFLQPFDLIPPCAFCLVLLFRIKMHPLIRHYTTLSNLRGAFQSDINPIFGAYLHKCLIDYK